MARFLAALFFAGATLGAASLAFHQEPGSQPLGVLAVAAVAYLVSAIVYRTRERAVPIAMVGVLLTGTALIDGAMLFTENQTGVYSMMFVWVALVGAYFLTWTQVGVQLAWIAASYAVVLIAEHPLSAPQQFMIAMGTVVVSAALVGILRRGVARLTVSLADSARTDTLTGLVNRRGFEELIEAELERSRRGDTPLSLLMIDLDDFNSVNDRWGHAAGDRALRLFARALRETVRRIDHAARVAGEEFAVVLPDTEAHSAFLLAERLRRRLAEEVPAHPVRLTVSIGVACSPRHGLTVSELMLAGDRALHAAKQLGRDRAVMYDSEIVGSLLAAAERGEQRREENIAAVMILAETLDIRDTGTARHSQTVARYACLIAERLGLPREAVERIRLAGVLHDIGKIGVADSILRKPAPLTEDEYEEMKRHSELGARILAGANLEDISAWVLAHHERPDGRGYPHALTAGQIPFEAKILAVADSYEAMTSDRVYRMALGHDAAQEELRRCAGTQFDAAIVDALIGSLDAEPLATA